MSGVQRKFRIFSECTKNVQKIFIKLNCKDSGHGLHILNIQDKKTQNKITES